MVSFLLTLASLPYRKMQANICFSSSTCLLSIFVYLTCCDLCTELCLIYHRNKNFIDFKEHYKAGAKIFQSTFFVFL